MTTQIVDSHVHLIDPSRLRYPWLPAGDALRRRWDLAQYAAAAPGVTAVIVVEAGVAAGHVGHELALVRAQAKARPQIHGIVARAPAAEPAALARALAGLAAFDLVAGIRWNLQDKPPGSVSEPGLVAGVRQVGAAGLPFDACVRASQLAELDHLAAACPDTMIVLDHAGKPRCGADLTSWRTAIRTLAARPNVRCKLSGLATEAAPGAGPGDLLGAVLAALQEFGAGRCMYGSDWPVCTLATTPRAWLELVTATLSAAGASQSERDHVLAGTAQATYRIAETTRTLQDGQPAESKATS